MTLRRLMMAVTVLALMGCTPVESEAPSPIEADLTEIKARLADLRAALSGVETYYTTTVAPLERALLNSGADEEAAKRIAVALVREGNRTAIDPWLLMGVLLIENPWLDPEAVSFMGAIGLMQVMPFHAGQWPACDGRLEEIEASICYGAQILAHYWDDSDGNLHRALLRYNGCVRGTNTPDCHLYPFHTMSRVFTAQRRSSS